VHEWVVVSQVSLLVQKASLLCLIGANETIELMSESTGFIFVTLPLRQLYGVTML
jgi:hypothetical protein